LPSNRDSHSAAYERLSLEHEPYSLDPESQRWQVSLPFADYSVLLSPLLCSPMNDTVARTLI
jgi:hypothetical protein